jgi:integrase
MHETRSRKEKLNRSWLKRFLGGEEEAYLRSGTVDRIKDEAIPGFHVRVWKRGSTWAWSNAKRTVTIGAVRSVDPDKARAIALQVHDRMKARQGVALPSPGEINAWIAGELNPAPALPVVQEIPGWTVAYLRERFLQHCAEQKLAEATVKGYRSDLHCPAIRAIENRKAATITGADVIVVRDSVLTIKGGAIVRGGVRSNRVLAAMSAMFSYGLGEGQKEGAGIVFNPVIGINRRGKEKKRTRDLKLPEIRRLLGAIPELEISPNVGLALLWTLSCGQRKRAAREARRMDFDQGFWLALPKKKGDEEDRRVIVPVLPLMKRIHDLSIELCRESQWVFPAQKTRYKGIARDVPVAESAMNDVIYRLQAKAQPERTVRSKKGRGSYKLAPTPPGPLSDLASFTVHDFRRALTGRLSDARFPLSNVSALLDHADLGSGAANMTVKVYLASEQVAPRRKALKAWHKILVEQGIEQCLDRLEAKWREPMARAA